MIYKRRSIHLADSLLLVVLFHVFTLVSLRGVYEGRQFQAYIQEEEGIDIRNENSLFASVEHMKPLMQIEGRLADIAKNYLKEQKRKMNDLAPFARSVEEAMDLENDDIEKYIGNPVNCYLIIKRFIYGWKELTSRLDIDEASMQDINDVLSANSMYMPSARVDLVGATAAIVRLMDSYEISAHDVVEGKIPDIEPASHQLTAQDCMDIADITHGSRRYVRMKEFLVESERLLHDRVNTHRHGNATLLEIYGYMSWSYYLENDLHEALRYINLILADDPENEDALRNKLIYQWYVDRNLPCTFPETGYMKSAHEVLEIALASNYIHTCKMKKNLKVLGVKNMAKLRSFYRIDLPRHYLKPVKVTQLHDNPEVYILHDIIRDKKLEELKALATPRLTVAEVINPLDGGRMVAPYRVSKSVFLMPGYPAVYPYDTKISAELNTIFDAASGLDMVYSEGLQINNYGLGGQYEFHHDYGLPGTTIPSGPDGNRIATLLLYMSDVESGGETVFTEIGLSVPPAKGSALFWFNLHRNGSVFVNTRHASCPVLSGSKWVANKWIKERGNEFRWRCSLNQYD